MPKYLGREFERIACRSRQVSTVMMRKEMMSNKSDVEKLYFIQFAPYFPVHSVELRTITGRRSAAVRRAPSCRRG